MKKNIIATANAPAAIGPYSQAIDCGSFIVTSGQIPIDPATGNLVEGGIQAQTEQSLKNIEAILAEADLTVDNVIKTTVFLADINDFAAINAIYAEYFTGEAPAPFAAQDGVCRNNVMGLYVHGLFEEGDLAARLAALLMERKGLTPGQAPALSWAAYRETQYDRLADAMRAALDLPAIYRMMEGSGRN